MKGLLLLLLLLLPQVTLTVTVALESCPDKLVMSTSTFAETVNKTPDGTIAKVQVQVESRINNKKQEAQVEILCIMKSSKGSESLSPTINVTISQEECIDGSVDVQENNSYILFLKKDYTAIAISADDESLVKSILNLECVPQSKSQSPSQSAYGQISDKQRRPALQGYAIIRRGEKALCSAALITGDWLIASAHCVRKHKGKQLTADIGSKRVDIKLIKIKKNRNLALLRLRPGLPNPDTMKLPIADDGAITSSTLSNALCAAIGVASTRPHPTRKLFCSQTCGAAPAEEAIIACYDGNAWVMCGVQLTGDDSCDDAGSSFTRLAYSKTLKWIKEVTKIGAKD